MNENKKIYKKLSSKLLETTVFNIMLVIEGLRPAFWMDSEIYKGNFDPCIEFTEDDMEKYKNEIILILKPLESLGIRYKFASKLTNEGPLVYNIHKTDKKIIKIIETNTIENIFPKPIFGKILGYLTPGIRENDCGIDFIVKMYKKEDGYMVIDEINLFSFRVPIEKKGIIKKIIETTNLYNNFIKKLDSKCSVGFRIESND